MHCGKGGGKTKSTRNSLMPGNGMPYGSMMPKPAKGSKKGAKKGGKKGSRSSGKT